MQRFLVCWGVAEAKWDSANCLSRFCWLHVRRFLHHLQAIYTFSSGNSSGGVDQARQETRSQFSRRSWLYVWPRILPELLNSWIILPSDQSSSAGITLTHWTDVVDNLRRWEIRWCQENQVGVGGNNEWLSPVWLTSWYAGSSGPLREASQGHKLTSQVRNMRSDIVEAEWPLLCVFL